MLLSASCLGDFHPSVTQRVSWHRQARAHCQALKEPPREAVEKPEDAPGTPVQAGEAPKRVSPHRGLGLLRVTHTVFLSIVVRPSQASHLRGASSGAGGLAALSLAEGCR